MTASKWSLNCTPDKVYICKILPQEQYYWWHLHWFYELPELVLMSFVANDMCHNKTLKFQTDDLYTRYYNDLIGTYKNVVTNMSAAKKGTDIFFITALDPVQILDNPFILSARKTFEDSTLTCGEIRNLKDKGRLSFIEGMCDSILAIELTDLNRVEFLKSRWLELKQAQIDATMEAQSWGPPGFTFKTITSVSEMKFLMIISILLIRGMCGWLRLFLRLLGRIGSYELSFVFKI